MQTQLFLNQKDFSQHKIMVGLSGGINSMAVLVWLSLYPENLKPKELHLFYAHFDEHSDDTERFVLDGVEYARKNFETVFYTQKNNSVLEFFRQQKMIPHPMLSPCTHVLKITPMLEYMVEHKIVFDLVGYVRNEKRRIFRMAEHLGEKLTDDTIKKGDIYKHFPISQFDDNWCFDIVKKYIGWYPAIYDIKDENGKRVFKHNNCLPCKNFNQKDYENTRKYYPYKIKKSDELALDLNQYWGRNKNDAMCQHCAFD